ncbi:MAG: hypothetical protein F6K39_12240 [Okeania sp. SIO3B3]|nr:hypothetical protein [Okeania sp. SIO3B3]
MSLRRSLRGRKQSQGFRLNYIVRFISAYLLTSRSRTLHTTSLPTPLLPRNTKSKNLSNWYYRIINNE